MPVTKRTEDNLAGVAGTQGKGMSSTRSARYSPGVPRARSRHDPTHRQSVLEHERTLAPSLFQATEEEQRALARQLGVEDHLPDPQPDLLASRA